MMSAITKENLRIQNISEKVIQVIEKKDTANKKAVVLKINLNGHNTGYSVNVSNAFFYNEKLKKEVVSHLEQLLNREVDFGTQHIYVGNKLM